MPYLICTNICSQSNCVDKVSLNYPHILQHTSSALALRAGARCEWLSRSNTTDLGEHRDRRA